MVIRNYLRVALRNQLRHKGYTLINIVGLALGFACTILILHFAWDEWHVDKHHPDGDNTYRLVSEEQNESGTFFQTGIVGGLGPALLIDFPEVEQAVRVINPSYLETWVYHEDQGFEQRFCVADEAILHVLDLPLLMGDPATVLDAPNALLITESTAQRYFGDANPIGQPLRVEGFWGGDYVVSGVLHNLPESSTIQFDVLSGNVPSLFDSWALSDWRPVELYVHLADDTRAHALENKIASWLPHYLTDEEAARVGFHLQPLEEVYLYSAADFGLASYGDITTVRLLAFIGGFILLLAIINFINLTTARATQRAKEVGVRKVVGASQRQLTAQFLSEAVLVAVLSLMIALGIAQLALPTVNSFTGKSLTLLGETPVLFLLGLGTGTVIVGLLAGLYPAVVLSSFQPVKVLKGSIVRLGHGAQLRKALVVFQFAITVVLVISTGIMYQQWTYLSEQKWGFNKDEVVTLPIIAVDPAPMWSENWLGFRQAALKDAFLQHPHVLSASVSHVTPPLSIPTRLRVAGDNEARPMHYIYADKDFLNTYEITLLEGRNFERDLLSAIELPDILLNETAVRQLGWDDPIGRQLVWEQTGITFTVIGVIQDFLNHDLSQPIQPFFLMQMSQPPQVLSLRLNLTNLPETMAFLETTWTQFLPSRPFQFEFANAQLQRYYQDDVRQGQIVGFFAVLAIMIGCLGLFGLAAFMAERRLPEVGVRKVLGATVVSITALLSTQFIRLVLIANILAWPVAYYAVNQWLDAFAYRITVEIEMFMLSGLLTFTIALLTVSYQAVKAGLSNPAEVLRSE